MYFPIYFCILGYNSFDRFSKKHRKRTHKKSPGVMAISKACPLKIPITPGEAVQYSIFYSLSCFYRCPNKLCKVKISVEALFIRKDCRIVYACRNRHLISSSLILKGNLCYHIISLCQFLNDLIGHGVESARIKGYISAGRGILNRIHHA